MSSHMFQMSWQEIVCCFLLTVFLFFCTFHVTMSNQISVNFTCNPENITGSPRFSNRAAHEIIEFVVPNKVFIELIAQLMF